MYYTVLCNVSYNTIIVFYPNLLVVGGGTHDKCAGIVRQDYTGAHIHALGWTSPQRLFILCLLRRERCQNSKWLRNLCNALPFETFFNLYNFHKSQCHLCVAFINYGFLLKKGSILLLILSVFNKLSTLSVPSMIVFFFLEISTCLFRPSLYCLVHFSTRLQDLNSKRKLVYMTMLILLDSVLQEVRATEIQIGTCVIWPSLYCLIGILKSK